MAAAAVTVLDHLLWAVPDLAAGTAAFAELTGVEPRAGGAHPGLGTANALVALRRPGTAGVPDAYLELIGPDPAQGLPPERVNLEVGRVRRPGLHTWAVRPDDLDATVAAARASGVDVGQVQASSRTTPAGDTLRWRLTSRTPLPLGGAQPFLIDWYDTPHPAASGLPELELLELAAVAPDVGQVRRVLDVLGLDVPVVPGAPGLRAVLGTPNGRVELRPAG